MVCFPIAAAWFLPPLDSHVRVQPAVKAAFAVASVLLLVGTLIALMAYFTRAWRKLGTVANKTEYMVWVGLETIAALSVLFGFVYSSVIFGVEHFR